MVAELCARYPCEKRAHIRTVFCCCTGEILALGSWVRERPELDTFFLGVPSSENAERSVMLSTSLRAGIKFGRWMPPTHLDLAGTHISVD